MIRSSPLILLVAGLGLSAVSCNREEPYSSKKYNYATYADVDSAAALFKDDAQTNSQVAAGALDLTFVDGEGKPVSVAQFRGKKNLLLVMTRGFNGQLCPYCSAQTTRLISNYPEFVKRDTEVLVVYPGPKEQVPQFKAQVLSQAKAESIPFPFVLDEDFKAVDQLGIRAELAKPSTFLLDKEGQLRFAYVGTSMTDRPSIKALLQQLDGLSKK